MAAKVRVEVEGDASGLASSVKAGAEDAGASLEGLSARAGLVAGAASAALTEAFRLVSGAVGSATAEIGAWIASSNAQETATRNLHAALAAAGQLTQQTSDTYHALASELQGTARVADEALLPAMSKLVSLGGVQQGQMRAATQAALDLSTALGVGLDSAFTMVAKGAAGSMAAFGRYGIQIEETGDKQRDFELLLAGLQARFGGFAAAEGAAFEGRMRGVALSIDDTREMLGDSLKRAFLPFLETVEAGAGKLQDFVRAHEADILDAFATAAAGVAQAMALVIRAGGVAAETYAWFRQVFANVLESFGPFIRAAAWVEEKLAGKPTGLSEALRDLDAGLKLNIQDQIGFKEQTGEAVDAINEQARALTERLSAGLGASKVGLQEVTAASQIASPSLLATGDASEKAAASATRLAAATGGVADQFLKVTAAGLREEALALVTTFDQAARNLGSEAGAVELMGKSILLLRDRLVQLKQAVPEPFQELVAQIEPPKASVAALEHGLLRVIDATRRVGTETEAALAAAAASQAAFAHQYESFLATIGLGAGGDPFKAGEPERVSVSPEKIQPLLDRLKQMAQQSGMPQLVTQAAAAIKEGNLAGLEQIVAILRDDQKLIERTFQAIPSTGKAPGLLASGLQQMVDLLRSMVIPARQIGGPVDAGRPYLVGERGPEVFVPSTGGSIAMPGESGRGFSAIVAAVERLGARIEGATRSAGMAPFTIVIDGREVAAGVTRRMERGEAGRV